MSKPPLQAQRRLVSALYRSLLRWCNSEIAKSTKFSVPVSQFAASVAGSSGQVPDLEALLGPQTKLHPVRNAQGVQDAIKEAFRKGVAQFRSEEATQAVSLAFGVLRQLGELEQTLQERSRHRAEHEDRKHAVYRVGEAVLHQGWGVRCVVVGWRIDDTKEQICRVLVDEFDSNYFGAVGDFVEVSTERLRPLPRYLTRIFHNRVNSYFSEFDNTAGRYVPSEDVAFEYPSDFDSATVTKSALGEVVEAGRRVRTATLELNRELQAILAKHGITAENYETMFDGVLKDVLKNVFKLDARLRGRACAVPAANAHSTPTHGMWAWPARERQFEFSPEEQQQQSSSSSSSSSFASSAAEPPSVFPKWANPTPLDLLSLEWWRGYNAVEALGEALFTLEALLLSRQAAAMNTEVLFHVGQVIRHKRFGYRGVICGYDNRPMLNTKDWDGVQGLPSGQEQPFYRVIPDERDIRDAFGADAWRPFTYVAQENVEAVDVDQAVIQHPNMPTVFKRYDAIKGVFEPLPRYKFSYPPRRPAAAAENSEASSFEEPSELATAHTVLEELYNVLRDAMIDAKDGKTRLLDDLHILLRGARRREDAIVVEALIWGVFMSHPSDRVRQLMRDGIFALERSNMEAAEEYFEEAFQLDGKYAEAANKLAVTHFHAGKYEECLQWALQTLEKNPRHYGALAGAARSCAKLGREEQATAYFIRVLELHPWAAHVPSELLACMQSPPSEPSPPRPSAKEEPLSSDEKIDRIVIQPSPIPQQEHTERAAAESNTEPTK